MPFPPDSTLLVHSDIITTFYISLKLKRWRKRQGRVRERKIINYWNDHRFPAPPSALLSLLRSPFNLKLASDPQGSVMHNRGKFSLSCQDSKPSPKLTLHLDFLLSLPPSTNSPSLLSLFRTVSASCVCFILAVFLVMLSSLCQLWFPFL